MKKNYRRLLSFLMILLFSLVLVACGGGEKDPSSSSSDNNQQSSSNGGSSSGDGTVREHDFGGMEIVFMVSLPHENDPFLDTYSGTNKVEKQAAQRAVEKKYNVKIVYKTYPDGAGWGPPRERAIIDAVTAGNPLAHFYQITSMWVANLASSNAIVPVGQYIRNHAHDYYDENLNQFSMYKGSPYLFDSGVAIHDTGEGLYYNMELLKELDLESPAALWNRGEWTWDKFKEYAATAQSRLGEGQAAVGGIPGVYAQMMAPANGGYIINPTTNKAAFNTTLMIKTINFLRDDIYIPGYWEESPEYDAGSASWKTGNVLFHPGELWFLNSNMRWLDLPFDVSYVPFPMGPDISSIDQYNVGKPGITAWAISGGYEKSKGGAISDEELFMIWNDLQVWKTAQDQMDGFEIRLISSYDDEESVEAHMSILQRVYNEQVFSLGIGEYSNGGFYVEVNRSTWEGDAKSKMDAIVPTYQARLNEIWG